MTRQLIALTLSLLASSTFAMAASEHAVPGDTRAAHQIGVSALAQERSDRLIHSYQRVADNGPDRLVQQYQRTS